MNAAAPVYFSTLERQIDHLPANKHGEVRADQARAWLVARAREGKCNQAELIDTGLDDCLALAGDAPVSRESLRHFLQANGVQVSEQVIGPDPALIEALQQLDTKLRATGHCANYNSAVRRLDLHVWSNNHCGNLVDHNKLPDEISALFLQMREMTRNLTRSYERYTLPGGEEYRELLLLLPAHGKKPSPWFLSDSEGAIHSANNHPINAALTPTTQNAATEPQDAFHSQHWQHPNVLAHARVDIRTAEDGTRTLFVEEIQSDWHQAGRNFGYHQPDTQALTVADKLKVLDAPFKTSDAWTSLVLKRLLRYAVDSQCGAIAWTHGGQQVDRFRSSTSEVSWQPVTDGFVNLSLTFENGRTQTYETFPVLALKDKLSKQVAEHVAARATEPGHVFPADLKDNCEGLRHYYDELIPRTLNRLCTRYGVLERADTVAVDGLGEQPGLRLSPALKVKVSAPQPLYRLLPAPPAKAIDRDVLMQTVQQIQSRWFNAPRIHVLESAADAQFAMHTQAQGAVYRNEVYLVRTNLGGVDDVRNTLLHEVEGHIGLLGVLGPRIRPVLEQIYHTNPTVRAAADAWLARDHSQDVARATEEVLAEMTAVDRQSLSGWSVLVSTLRGFVHQTFPGALDWTENDVHHLLDRCRRHVMEAPEALYGPHMTLVYAADHQPARLAALISDWNPGALEPETPLAQRR